jgi:hypothetical protein
VADTGDSAETTRRRGNWRHRENRASSKYVAKRVSEEDHSALTRYAEAHGVKVAELLTPFIDDLIEQAHQFCVQVDDRGATVKAS